jgi:tetratricopeptide (TPR) repeat protein
MHIINTSIGSATTKPDGVVAEASYTKVLDKVFKEVLAENGELDRQRTMIPELLAELEALTITQRRLLIRNSRRYQVWPLAEALLVECRSKWGDDPEHSECLAEVASEIADRVAADGYRAKLLSDLKAEIWCHIANCRRIKSDLDGAARAFGVAEQHLRSGSGDAMERARFLDLKSSLLRAQRKFSAAASALEEAIRIYRSSGDRHAEGRAQVNQAKLLADGGRPKDAIPVLERAACNIDGRREPRLILLLKWNLAYHLTEAGRPVEARSLLPEVRRLVRQHGGKHDRLRVLWLEGAVRSSLGQLELAEEALRQVREGFVAGGIGYDVALVSLDLAAVYLKAGKTDQVRRLAVETMPLFSSRNVKRELLVAWQLFKEAADRDIATLCLVGEVAGRIRKSQSGPANS